MNKKYILGNWKMNGLRRSSRELAMKISTMPLPSDVEIVLFPPFTALDAVAAQLPRNSAIKMGAQDCSQELSGAFTGDVSAEMLRDVGCSYVILGHSERRTGHHETDAMIRNKAISALKYGLIPVICVGESAAERESGRFLDTIRAQVQISVPPGISEGFIIAYEPVWAIGSGKIPTVSEITQVHKTIASQLSYATSGARAAIAYGGSVKADNALAILSAEEVDGVLVGGASLKAEEFCAIVAAAR